MQNILLKFLGENNVPIMEKCLKTCWEPRQRFQGPTRHRKASGDYSTYQRNEEDLGGPTEQEGGWRGGCMQREAWDAGNLPSDGIWSRNSTKRRIFNTCHLFLIYTTTCCSKTSSVFLMFPEHMACYPSPFSLNSLPSSSCSSSTPATYQIPHRCINSRLEESSL